MVFQPTVLRLLPPVVSPVYTALPVSSTNIVYLSIATTSRCSIIACLCPSLNHRKVHLFPCQATPLQEVHIFDSLTCRIISRPYPHAIGNGDPHAIAILQCQSHGGFCKYIYI